MLEDTLEVGEEEEEEGVGEEDMVDMNTTKGMTTTNEDMANLTTIKVDMVTIKVFLFWVSLDAKMWCLFSSTKLAMFFLIENGVWNSNWGRGGRRGRSEWTYYGNFDCSVSFILCTDLPYKVIQKKHTSPCLFETSFVLLSGVDYMDSPTPLVSIPYYIILVGGQNEKICQCQLTWNIFLNYATTFIKPYDLLLMTTILLLSYYLRLAYLFGSK